MKWTKKRRKEHQLVTSSSIFRANVAQYLFEQDIAVLRLCRVYWTVERDSRQPVASELFDHLINTHDLGHDSALLLRKELLDLGRPFRESEG